MDKMKDVEWAGRVLVYFYDSLLNISVEYLCTKLIYISKVEVILNFLAMADQCSSK